MLRKKFTYKATPFLMYSISVIVEISYYNSSVSTYISVFHTTDLTTWQALLVLYKIHYLYRFRVLYRPSSSMRRFLNLSQSWQRSVRRHFTFKSLYIDNLMRAGFRLMPIIGRNFTPSLTTFCTFLPSCQAYFLWCSSARIRSRLSSAPWHGSWICLFPFALGWTMFLLQTFRRRDQTDGFTCQVIDITGSV